MPIVKFLEHSNIDFKKWNDCVQNSQNSMVYGFSWYLDKICNKQWAALVYGDYEAVFPLPWKKKYGLKYVYQPFFCQQLGVFSSHFSNQFQDIFLDAIPNKFVKVDLQINNYFPVQESLQKRRNYVLHLNQNYVNLKSQFSQDCIKNLKRGALVEFTISTDIALAIDNYKNYWGALVPQIKDYHYDAFSEACNTALSLGNIEIIKAEKNGQLLGTAILLKTKKFLHNVCGAPTAEGRKLSVMHGIIDFVIQQHAGEDIYFDFEGSEIPNVAAFYQKFSPVEQHYLIFKRNILKM